jgi:hypothetical protein
MAKPTAPSIFSKVPPPTATDKTARHTARLYSKPLRSVLLPAIEFGSEAKLTSILSLLRKSASKVEMRGLEPLTSALQRRRSPS